LRLVSALVDDDADDVVQGVFVGLTLALRGYEERGTFAAWLRGVTVRTALSRRRDTMDVARLAERAMTLVPITGEPPSGEVAEYLTKHPVGAPVYFDPTSATRRAFGQWTTPEYYLLDARGVVRFKRSTIDLVLAQAVSLAEE
jgi:DNA-directed RNA polymerase specialized sigma24 family protein